MRGQRKGADKKAETQKVRISENENKVLLESAQDAKGEILRVTLNRFKGRLYLGIAKWWTTDGVNWNPGKGLRMPYDPEAVEFLKQGISALEAGLDIVDFR
jgi:hypothetical protein